MIVSADGGLTASGGAFPLHTAGRSVMMCVVDFDFRHMSGIAAGLAFASKHFRVRRGGAGLERGKCSVVVFSCALTR